MIRAVIFDVGGVLVRLDWERALQRWDTICGVPPGAVLSELFRGFDNTVLIGRCGADAHWARAASNVGLTPDQLSVLMRDLQAAETFDAELDAYISRLRPRYKTALLSNGWTDARTARWRPRLDELVDDVVISAEVGLAKPAPQIYALALERLGVTASETIFVDDQIANINAARDLGFHTVLHQATAKTINALAERLESTGGLAG